MKPAYIVATMLFYPYTFFLSFSGNIAICHKHSLRLENGYITNIIILIHMADHAITLLHF